MTGNFDLYGIVVIILLVVAIPLEGMATFRRLLRWTAAGRPDARVRTYLMILALEWILAGTLLGWWLGLGRAIDPLRLYGAPSGWQWLAVAGGLGLMGLQVAQWRRIREDRVKLRELAGEFDQLMGLAPRNPMEARLFDALGVTAGICEEVLYRGILLAITQPIMGTSFAVVVTSVVFGLGHLYQGSRGVLKTGAVGLVLALMTLWTGSILTAVVVHAVTDLVAGRVLALVVEEVESRPD
ncbi:MAG: CPBP family intramembrane glutamic endopeptidase [bacterium]